MMKCPCTRDHGQALKHWKLAYTQYKWQMEVKQATDYFLKNVILHLSTSTNACLHSLLSLSNACHFCVLMEMDITHPLCIALVFSSCYSYDEQKLLVVKKTRPLTEEEELN